MQFKIGDKVVLNAKAVEEGVYKHRTSNMPAGFKYVIIGRVVGYHTNPPVGSNPRTDEWSVNRDIVVVNWLVQSDVLRLQHMWLTQIHSNWLELAK